MIFFTLFFGDAPVYHFPAILIQRECERAIWLNIGGHFRSANIFIFYNRAALIDGLFYPAVFQLFSVIVILWIGTSMHHCKIFRQEAKHLVGIFGIFPISARALVAGLQAHLHHDAIEFRLEGSGLPILCNCNRNSIPQTVGKRAAIIEVGIIILAGRTLGKRILYTSICLDHPKNLLI